MTTAPRILYLVHDLSDPAVLKRVAMLKEGGAHVTVAGFRRSELLIEEVGGCPAIDLGQTYNGNFLQRIKLVLRHCLRPARLKRHAQVADVIIARNLEMLALAVRVRTCPVVYESLDIHRLLLRTDPLGAALRWLEGFLAARAHLLITSSPAFVREYFAALSRVRLPVLLIENKVFAASAPAPAQPRKPGAPWVIGWFGAIRCKKSLAILREVVSRGEGLVQVVIRGRPSYDQFEDFDAQTSDTPGLSFIGPYKNPDDLPAMYHQAHFTWAIDMFEEGQNSSWLLPNRLYEGSLYGSVPLAHAGVETGKRMEQMHIGIRLPEINAESVLAALQQLSGESYRTLEAAVKAQPASQFLHDASACQNLVRRLSALSGKPTPAPLPIENL